MSGNYTKYTRPPRRCRGRRLTHDTEGQTVRPRTRQTRKEPTMPTTHAVSDRIALPATVTWTPEAQS